MCFSSHLHLKGPKSVLVSRLQALRSAVNFWFDDQRSKTMRPAQLSTDGLTVTANRFCQHRFPFPRHSKPILSLFWPQKPHRRMAIGPAVGCNICWNSIELGHPGRLQDALSVSIKEPGIMGPEPLLDAAAAVRMPILRENGVLRTPKSLRLIASFNSHCGSSKTSRQITH